MPTKRFRQVESVEMLPRATASGSASLPPDGRQHPFVEQLIRAWPPDECHDDTVIVAISGGADSVALLRVMATLMRAGAGRVVAAHFNHRLRGDTSDADQAFVEALCGEIGLPLTLGTADVAQLAQEQGDGVESAAREARYAFLADAARKHHAPVILTAHTADDQAETILHRVLRGTGLTGLAGIPRRRELSGALALVRPMLEIRRQQVLSYLDDLGQSYREDESNADRRFTRNRLRHELLENLREHYNPQVTEALLRLGTLAGEAQEVVTQLVRELLPRCVSVASHDRISIASTPLQDKPRYLVRELLLTAWRRQSWPEQSMGFAEWEMLADMLLAKDNQTAPRQRMFPGRITARRVGQQLELSRAAT